MGGLNDFKENLLEHIDRRRDDLVNLLCELIEHKPLNLGTSGTGQELATQNWLRDYLSEFGFDNVDYWAVDPEKKRPNVLATIKGDGLRNALIYNGHIDVVPVHDFQLHRWTVDPWKATVKEGSVYGRGASDMLGGIAGMVFAAIAILEQGGDLKGSLHIESVPGEESNEGYLWTKACIEGTWLRSP